MLCGFVRHESEKDQKKSHRIELRLIILEQTIVKHMFPGGHQPHHVAMIPCIPRSLLAVYSLPSLSVNNILKSNCEDFKAEDKMAKTPCPQNS